MYDKERKARKCRSVVSAELGLTGMKTPETSCEVACCPLLRRPYVSGRRVRSCLRPPNGLGGKAASVSARTPRLHIKLRCSHKDPNFPVHIQAVLRVSANFSVKRRSLGRYSSVADYGHAVIIIIIYNTSRYMPTSVCIIALFTHCSDIKEQKVLWIPECTGSGEETCLLSVIVLISKP
jgi:hypothetical protein